MVKINNVMKKIMKKFNLSPFVLTTAFLTVFSLAANAANNNSQQGGSTNIYNASNCKMDNGSNTVDNVHCGKKNCPNSSSSG